MTAPITAPTTLPQFPGLVHIVCECSPDVGLCGKTSIDMGPLGPPGEAECHVCNDLDPHPCPRCGGVSD